MRGLARGPQIGGRFGSARCAFRARCRCERHAQRGVARVAVEHAVERVVVGGPRVGGGECVGEPHCPARTQVDGERGHVFGDVAARARIRSGLGEARPAARSHPDAAAFEGSVDAAHAPAPRPLEQRLDRIDQEALLIGEEPFEIGAGARAERPRFERVRIRARLLRQRKRRRRRLVAAAFGAVVERRERTGHRAHVTAPKPAGVEPAVEAIAAAERPTHAAMVRRARGAASGRLLPPVRALTRRAASRSRRSAAVPPYPRSVRRSRGSDPR